MRIVAMLTRMVINSLRETRTDSGSDSDSDSDFQSESGCEMRSRATRNRRAS